MRAAILALLVCGSVKAARAERDASNQLGFRIVFDRLPIADHDVLQIGLGLAVEHPVFAHWRVFGEYDWLWLSETTSQPMDVELQGSGHRTSLGIRHELMGGGLAKVLHFYIDGEVGGGVGMFSDNLTGANVVPHAFAGLRLGYTFRGKTDDKPSATSFGCAMMLRAIVVEHGAGGLFGMSFDWGG